MSPYTSRLNAGPQRKQGPYLRCGPAFVSPDRTAQSTTLRASGLARLRWPACRPNPPWHPSKAEASGPLRAVRSDRGRPSSRPDQREPRGWRYAAYPANGCMPRGPRLRNPFVPPSAEPGQLRGGQRNPHRTGSRLPIHAGEVAVNPSTRKGVSARSANRWQPRPGRLGPGRLGPGRLGPGPCWPELGWPELGWPELGWPELGWPELGWPELERAAENSGAL